VRGTSRAGETDVPKSLGRARRVPGEAGRMAIAGVRFFRRPVWRAGFCAGAMAALGAMAVPAFGSLGGSASSVTQDRAAMQAQQETVAHGVGYDIHEMRAPYGTVVDEYVSNTGTVFAVTWRGQFPPQLQQVLGKYFQEYKDALAAQPHEYGHHPLNIQEPGLVVQTFGHMGAYYGRAYLPDQVPAGVEADQIR